MRNYAMIQYTTMLILCFICGVLCYQLFDLTQIEQVITLFDRRLLTKEAPAIIWSVVPFLTSVIIVLFFSTHPYLAPIALLFIALKLAFFGLSSVFLLVQHNTMTLYAFWWFPFQLLYSLLWIVLYEWTRPQKQVRAVKIVVSAKKIRLLLFAGLLIVILEIFCLTYLFK